MTPNPYPLLLAEFSPGLNGPTLLVTAILVLIAWSLRWVYLDAEARGKQGWMVALLVLLTKWPLSLLLWMASRPDLPPRQLANEQNKCVNCQTPIEHSRHLCAHCASLK
jgi:hypothetical protein